MQILISKSKYQIIIEDNHKKILKSLQIGTSIPILPKFTDFLIRTFKNYDVKAILLRKKINNHLFEVNDENIVGICLLFNDDNEVLFFGFFGTYDHNSYKINILIDELKKYARRNKFKKIFGPVNIPIIIFGFGFMEEGSNKQLATGKPVNPPIYQRLFIKQGFYIKYIEENYYSRAFRFDPDKLPGYDFSEFEFINLTKENLHEYLDDMIRLHKNNMPEYSKITPNTEKNVKVLFDYLFSYEKDFLVWVVKHIPSNQIVACGHIAPNPFIKDKKGRLTSASIEHVVVDKKFQGQGITMYMYGKTFSQAINPETGERIKYCTNSIGINNKRIIDFTRKYINGIMDRRHFILEYNFDKAKLSHLAQI